MNMIPRALAAFFLLAALAACSKLTSENPVGGSHGLLPDTRVLGGWKFVESEGKKVPSDASSYVFLLPKDNGGYSGMFLSWEGLQTGKSGLIPLDVFTSEVGNSWIASVRIAPEASKDQENDRYSLYLYRLEADGRLHVYDASPDGLVMVQKAVQAGRLAGAILPNKAGDGSPPKPDKDSDVKVTADSRALDAYFAANASKIFTVSLYVLERVK